MTSEYPVKLKEIMTTDIDLDSRGPYVPKADYTSNIKMETDWALSENKIMYITFSKFSFITKIKDKDAERITININYFCAADRGGEELSEIDDAVMTELDNYDKTIISHYFIKDLNDLLLRAGYPPVRFSSISIQKD